jgi:small subunit ribosomal protein S6
MAKYELMVIVRPDMAEEETGKLVTQMESITAATGGKVEKVERMGRRRLAYRVHKQREGIYVRLDFEGDGATVHELERRLKVMDSVLKFMTIRVDDMIQRAAKFKARLARQETRKPKPKSAAAGPPELEGESPTQEAQPRSE